MKTKQPGLKPLDAKTLVAFWQITTELGHRPTIKEVAEAISYSTPSAWQAFTRLKLMGYLEQPGSCLWRGYRLTPAGEALAQQLGAGQ